MITSGFFFFTSCSYNSIEAHKHPLLIIFPANYDDDEDCTGDFGQVYGDSGFRAAGPACYQLMAHL